MIAETSSTRQPATELPVPGGEPMLLLWSATAETAEPAARSALRGQLARTSSQLTPVPAVPVAGAVRRAAVVTGSAQAHELLDRPDRRVIGRRLDRPATNPRPVMLLLPGQGAQYRRMAAGLYRQDPVFTDAVDTVLTAFGADADDIRSDWLSADPVVDIDDVRRAQPLLFAVDYAVTRMLCSWGVRPAAVLGHSAGEVVAAVLAGVLSLPDAVRMQRDRVDRMQHAPRGGMLAVAASPERLRPYLDEFGVVIGVHNDDRQVLLSGRTVPLARLERQLRTDGYFCRPVGAQHPFHGPDLAEAAAASAAVCRRIAKHPPQLPLYSCYTGAPLTVSEATETGYWSGQPAAPVRFGAALDALLKAGDALLVECGPGQGLTTVARRHRALASGLSDALAVSPPRPGEAVADRSAALAAAGRLWVEGHDLEWAAVAQLGAIVGAHI